MRMEWDFIFEISDFEGSKLRLNEAEASRIDYTTDNRLFDFEFNKGTWTTAVHVEKMMRVREGDEKTMGRWEDRTGIT
jgi:hypothetical protein